MDNQLAFRSKMQMISELPAFKAELKLLYETGDASFMELAQDFLLCKRELIRLQSLNKLQRAQEYEEVFKELEKELFCYLHGIRNKLER